MSENKNYVENNLAKSNFLIQSKNKTSVLGNKLIALGLFYLQNGEYEVSKNGGNLVCKISAAEIRGWLGNTGNSLYRDLDKTAKRLMRFQLGYKDEDSNEFRYINLITEMQYKHCELSITFNGDLKMYLRELKDNYTILNLPLMLRWQKAYTFRLFELLSSRAYMYRDEGYRCEARYGLSELKFMLGCYDITDDRVVKYLKDKMNPDYEMAEKALYETSKSSKKEEQMAISKTNASKYADFKRNIIDPIVDEINDTPEADMVIDEVEPLRKGRGGKVYGVIFKYRTHINESNKEEDNDSRIEEINLSEDEKFDFEATVKREIFNQHKLPINDIRAICAAANYDMDVVKRANSQLNLQRGEIQNVTGWVISCIRNNYQSQSYESEKPKKQNSFSKFQQRNYSKRYNQLLEKIMMGIQLTEEEEREFEEEKTKANNR